MNDDNTSLVVNSSNSVKGKVATIATGALKENESDTSNDDLEQDTSQGMTRTNGNNSDEASGYFTEERVNTSVEDVSTLVLSPVTRDYLSSETDSNSCDSNSNLELKLGLIDEPPMINAAKTKLKTSNVTETPVDRLDNAIEPSELCISLYHVVLPSAYFICVVHCNKPSTNLLKRLQKQCTTINMLNLLMILM